MDKGNSGESFFSGFLMGGVVGSVVTFWLCERVRRQLSERGIEVEGWPGQVGAMISEKADEMLVRTREAVTKVVEEGTETINKAISHLGERLKKERDN